MDDVSFFEKGKPENANLREEVKKKDYENSHLQKDLEVKNKQIKNLLHKLEELRDDYDERIRLKDLELVARKTEYEELQRRSEIEYEKLKNDLNELDQLRRDKTNLTNSLKKKGDELDVLKKQFDTDLTKVKIKFEQAKQNLKAQEEHMRNTIQEEIHMKAMSLVGRKSKEIYEENQELIAQQRSLGKDLVNLGDSKDKLELENKQLIREKKIIEESLKGYAKQTIRLAKEIKELHSKIEGLQDALSNQKELFMNEKSQLIQHYNTRIEEMNQSLTETTNLLRSRTRELVHIKKLAERIVQQRNQLEMFFTEAFGYIKEQRMKEMQQEEDSIPLSFQNEHAFSGRAFPPIYVTKTANGSRVNTTKNRRIPSSSLYPTLSEQVDFTQLSWEDKEKVLKLLFQKINSTVVYPTPNTIVSTSHSVERVPDFVKPIAKRPKEDTTIRLNTPNYSARSSHQQSSTNLVGDRTFITNQEVS